MAEWWPLLVFISFLILSFSRVSRVRSVNEVVALVEVLYHRLLNRNFRLNLLFKPRSLSADEKKTVYAYFQFYRHLSKQERLVFDDRLIRFRESRKFFGRQNLEVSDKMKLLVSATAVKITFGMRSYMIREFEEIIFYPNAYQSLHSQEVWHKGEVNPNGIVVLSWFDFYEGIADASDGLNLGLHEFAHTLALQRRNNPLFTDYFFIDHFDKLMKHVSNPVFRKQISERAELRKYAAENPMEFFAVATEVFFETPELLYRNHSSVYRLFCKIYNQDPLRLYLRPVLALD